MIRAAFGNNNVDTCARVCHSPTGYGLKQTFGTSAGTQDFKSVDEADVIVRDRRQPDRRAPGLRLADEAAAAQGAALVVIDPRRIDLVRSPHVEAAHHLQLSRGTNVAIVNAIGHVVVTEGLVDRAFVAQRCEADSFAQWEEFIARPENSPEATEQITGVPAEQVRAAARLYATAPNAAIYYGLGVTEHSQGSTMVMGMANLAMATGNIGREGVGVNPLRGQNNVQGSCDMGSFPHELPGYRHVSDDTARGRCSRSCGAHPRPRARAADPEHVRRGHRRHLPRHVRPGRGHRAVRPQRQARQGGAGISGPAHRAGPVPQRDRRVRPRVPARDVVPGEGRHVHQRRAADQPGPPGDGAESGKQEWQVACELATAMGYPMHYDDGAPDHGRDRRHDPDLRRGLVRQLDEVGSMQWPCNAAAPDGTPTMHVDGFVRGKGHFVDTPFVPTDERTSRKFPLILTTGRILSQYNVGAQTRRTANVQWHGEDVLEIHPHDAEERGIADGAPVAITSRVGPDGAAGPDRRPDAAGRGLHDVPLPQQRREHRDDGLLGLGDQLPRVQGHRRPDRADVAGTGQRAGAPGSGRGAAVSDPAALVRMVNQIAANVAHHPHDQAVAEITRHLRATWAPSMRADLVAYVDGGGLDLTPLAAAAAEQLRVGDAKP